MARTPHWYRFLPEAIACLETLESPIIDRRWFEEELKLSPHGALDVMKRLGPTRQAAGRAWFIERNKALKALRAIAEEPTAEHQIARFERLTDLFERARKHSRARQVSLWPRESWGRLPEGCELMGTGRLAVEFGCARELLERLYALVKLAAADYEAFEKQFGEDRQAQQAGRMEL